MTCKGFQDCFRLAWLSLRTYRSHYLATSRTCVGSETHRTIRCKKEILTLCEPDYHPLSLALKKMTKRGCIKIMIYRKIHRLDCIGAFKACSRLFLKSSKNKNKCAKQFKVTACVSLWRHHELYVDYRTFTLSAAITGTFNCF